MLILCFDLDGTLCNSATAEEAACREVVNRIISWGFEPSRAAQAFDTQYQAYEERYVDLVISRGLGEKEIRLMQITDTLKVLGVEDRGLAAELSAAHWSTMSRLFAYYPEAPQALESLREKYRISLLSNGPSDLQRQKIRALGLDGCFEHVVISGEVGYSKPSREIFEELLIRVKAKARQVTYIGDNYMKDIVGALGAGLRAVWVNRDERERPSHPLKPERTIKDLSELARVLE
ncbi:MAG: HAD family hydrolase [Candidatus Bathyarchaeota archaeon]